MKKSLYLTSALVAVSVLALGSTDTMAASKAKKMSLGVSGSYKAMVGYAKQSSAFTNVASDTTRNTYSAMDIKTDSEIHFKGKTKTDSGLAIGIAIELETDQTKNTGDHIDQTYMTIDGGFGSVAIGSTVAASLILSVNAPSTGALGVFGGDSGEWIIKPTANKVSAVAGGNIGGNDRQKVRWISNSMSGFKIGASYVPSMTVSGVMPKTGGNTGTEVTQADAGVHYTGKIGANAMKAGVTYWTQDAGTASYDAYQVGASTTMGAFTLGAGYMEVNPRGKDKTATVIKGSGDSSLESETINLGVQWAQGPTTLSANYFKVEMPLGSAVTGDDSLERWTLGAKYAMGPGVDFLGTIQNVVWNDELTTAVNNNKGVAIVGGIKVAF